MSSEETIGFELYAASCPIPAPNTMTLSPQDACDALGIDPDMPLDALRKRLALTDDDLAVLERVRAYRPIPLDLSFYDSMLASLRGGDE